MIPVVSVALSFSSLAFAATPAPYTEQSLWIRRAGKCAPVDPADPTGPKQYVGTNNANTDPLPPTVHLPFHATAWTFRFLNANNQPAWTEPYITAVADAAGNADGASRMRSPAPPNAATLDTAAGSCDRRLTPRSVIHGL